MVKVRKAIKDMYSGSPAMRPIYWAPILDSFSLKKYFTENAQQWKGKPINCRYDCESSYRQPIEHEGRVVDPAINPAESTYIRAAQICETIT